MVTETNDVRLTWDAFLDDEDDGAYSQIEGFRETEWHNIRRQLRNDFSWDIPDGLEPHWTAPGRAIFWQQQIIRERVMRVDDRGRNRPVVEDVERGWAPTTSGLPAGSASQIAHWLDKGLRMRPPVDGVDAEALMAAVPSDRIEVEPEPIPEDVFFCYKHGMKQRGFKTWKLYAAHCAAYREIPELEPPDDVKEAMKAFKFYCLLHNVGFNNNALARRHVRNELRKPGKPVHQTLEQMMVQKEESDAD